MRFKLPSWVLALFACLLWSTAFVGVKYALTFAPPLFVAGIRFILAGLVIIPLCYRDYLNTVRRDFKVILLVSLLQTFTVYLLYFLALNRIQASTGAALVGLGPMIGAVLGHFFIKSETFTRQKIISFILGITGVTLVSMAGGVGGTLPNLREVLGIGLFILSSVAGAVSNVVVVKYKQGINPYVLTSTQMSFGGLLLLMVALFTYDNITLILPIPFYLALFWLVFVSAAGFSIWYYLLAKRRESLISMNIWKFIMPVTGGVLGWIIMPDDSPSVVAIMGMFTVALSIFIFYRRV